MLVTSIVCVKAQCSRRCRREGECTFPTCGPSCCRYWNRFHSRRNDTKARLAQIYRFNRSTSDCGNPSGMATNARALVQDSDLLYPALTVLMNNSEYRLSDIIAHGGIRWRRDSIRVLTRPQYRHSALHDLLMATSMIDGVPLMSLPAHKLEALLRRAANHDSELTGLSTSERAGGITYTHPCGSMQHSVPKPSIQPQCSAHPQAHEV